jgi:hypothetical protein
MSTFLKIIHSGKIIIFFLIFLFLFCSPQGFTVEKTKACPEEPTQSTVSQGLELTEEQISQVLEGMERLNQAILQASQEIPRDTFDPQAIVDNIGEDSKSLFEWVRDETILVPYQGSLRGPTGVLMDRCGNSLDRALLLHELLHLAGYEVRLTQGSLSEKQATEILGDISQFQDKSPNEKSKTDFENLIQVYAQEYGIATEELQEIKARLIDEKDRISKVILDRGSEQTKALTDLLKKEQRKKSDRERISAAKDLRDHWWVQEEENGDWLDLDPTERDGQPGGKLTAVDKTWNTEDLDEDLFHLLTIRIIVERWEEGRLKEETVLEHTLRPSNHVGERIELHHDPLNWPQDDELYNNDQPIQNLKETVLNLEEWIPVLMVGSENIGKKSFTKSGIINEKPGEKAEQRSGGVTGGLMGAFGSSRTKTEDQSILTAEWIEFEIRPPGQSHRQIRREIFDLMGPAKRKSSASNKPKFSETQILKRNLLILGQTEILALVCKLSPEFTEYLSAREMLSDMEVLLNLAKDHATIENADIIAQMALISPLPGPLYNLALSRSSLSRFDKETYLDSLNLFCLQTFLQPNPFGELEEFQKTDIVLNDVAVHPESKEDPFQIRLEQGILETNAEVEHTISKRWTDNTALLFTESLAQGIDWVFIRDARDPALQKAQMAADTRAYIEQDLVDGYVVVAPPKPIPINGKPTTGWWRIDPRSGTTIGMSGSSSGQAMTQYVRSVNMALQLKAAIQIHAGIMRCMAAAITSPLRGNRPQNDRITLRCIWVTVCSNVQRIAKGLMNIDVNWTNIIINETVNWALKSLCKALWEEGIEK